MMIAFYVIFMYCILLKAKSMEVNLDFHSKFATGENRYKEIVDKTYGDCWKNALANLHTGCKHLTEETQSRLALSFTNCFLEHSGSKICPCPIKTQISDCLRNASDRVFSTYTEFFTHTQSICHYLQHRQWQQQTEKTVVMLTETSESVSKKLDESSKSQAKILDLQQVALLDQLRLISNGRTLNVELQKSRNHAKTVFEEFKSTTNEQRLLIFEVFDRIKSLQNLVLGEFTSIYTFVYYIVGVFLIYILTSIPPTANARLCLLLLISLNAVIERTLVSYSLDEEMLKMFPLDTNGPMYTRIWMCRKVISFFGIAVLLYHYYRYKDYNTINNRLLREIQQQNSDIQEFIKSVKLSQQTSLPINIPKMGVVLPSPPKTQVTVTRKFNFDVNSSHNKSNTSEDSSIKSKPDAEKTPVKTVVRKRTKQNNTPKENILLSPKENIEVQGSPHTRYNLRSRVNSPAQSPFNTKSPLQPSDLVAAVTKCFEAKSIVSPRI